jgi:hypothetical protein
MGDLGLAAFALLTGLTVSGISGSLFELALARTLSFSEPFVSAGKPGRSIAVTLLAGPLMLANDAFSARREGAISGFACASCAATALVWALSIGVVVLHLAAQAATLLV